MNGHDFGAAYEQHAANLVTSGKMPESVLDTAVGNVLRVKARLGLIPAAYELDGVARQHVPSMMTNVKLVQTNLGDNPAHVAVAEKAARESVVLLSNSNIDAAGGDGGTAGIAAKKALPLDPTKVKKLLLLGPNCDEVRTGDYSAAGWVSGMRCTVGAYPCTAWRSSIQFEMGTRTVCVQ